MSQLATNMMNILLGPAVIGMAALFLSVVWMLRDERDRTRPLLVIALVVNLFYGWLLSFVMGQANGLVPSKFDYILRNLDTALGVPASAVAAILQPARLPLLVIYQLMVPMMIAWFLVARQYSQSRSIVVAYIAEMTTGPLLYAIVPGCGPLYAFHAQWLHPPLVPSAVVRLTGMPNAFPSLHAATALVFLSFARGRLWQSISFLFFTGTILATIVTGEHYAIDLVPGLAFGCFAANAGKRNIKRAISFFGLVLAWSNAVRFEHQFLTGHPAVLQVLAALTLIAAIADVGKGWLSERQTEQATDGKPIHASV
jgi:hypothetical protein